ncbi:MAG: hypothetical protein R3F55_05945 [Alphaproteobacteria bacterium]
MKARFSLGAVGAGALAAHAAAHGASDPRGGCDDPFRTATHIDRTHAFAPLPEQDDPPRRDVRGVLRPTPPSQ